MRKNSSRTGRNRKRREITKERRGARRNAMDGMQLIKIHTLENFWLTVTRSDKTFRYIACDHTPSLSPLKAILSLDAD